MCRAANLTDEHIPGCLCSRTKRDKDLSKNKVEMYKVSFWAVICLIPFHVTRCDGTNQSLLYGLNCSGLESRWETKFSTHVQKILLYNWHLGHTAGKTAEEWCWPTTPASVEVKGRVKLYFYSPVTRSCQVIRWNLPLNIRYYIPHNWKDTWMIQDYRNNVFGN